MAGGTGPTRGTFPSGLVWRKVSCAAREGMWASLRFGALLVGIGLLFVCPVCAQEGAFLRLVPPEMDVAAAIETIANEGLPVEAIVIDVCHSGQALFPLSGAAPPPSPTTEDDPFGAGSELLPQDDPVVAPEDMPFIVREGFEDGTRLQEWIDLAHAKGLKVYAGMDLLRWWLPWSSDPNPLDMHPDLVELDSDLTCEGEEPARYASPWHPVVRASLRALMRELGARYPDLDGLYVECRLSQLAWLGFSDDARVAYIRHARVDPIDLPVFGVDPKKHPPLKTWMEWRKEYLAQFLGAVTSGWREVAPGKRVAARASSCHAAYLLRYQAYSCQNWVRWLLTGAVDDLMLEVEMHRVNQGAKEFRAGHAVYQELALVSEARLTVPGEQRAALLPIGDNYTRLTEMEIPKLPLFFDPQTAEQLEVVMGILRTPPPG